MKRDPFHRRLYLIRRLYEDQLGNRRVTDSQFGAVLGMKPPTFSKWKDREDSPPHDLVEVIAAKTGVNVGWLAYGPALSGVKDPTRLALPPERESAPGQRAQSHAPAKTPAEVFGRAGKRKRGGSKE